jgi:asparagine synthase (glutamine-hydrolysing)
MCGIVGYRVRRGSSEALSQALDDAVVALTHRGPDASGTWTGADGVGLGHRRLAVLDLSPFGAQPMLSSDGEIAIVYNGEVYNFAEIAEELRKKGYPLRGNSDTETIIAAYREWGAECVNRFIGMFAFAIWDSKQRRLSLCRDRVGVKPLYYNWDGRVLSFASELKALRALPHWLPRVDMTAVGELLQYGYVGGSRSIYEGVHKLPPGCWLHLDEEGEPRVEHYWSLRGVVEKGPLRGTPRVLEDELEALLLSACRYRMVSDVPVGLFLSGGIDSSLVAGLLKSAGYALETFTIGFQSSRHDESAAAARVAEALGFSNRALIVDEAEAWRVLETWPDLYDEPFGDHSGIPTYLVSRLAREHVAVAISADGGDELFCGYSGYAEAAARMTSQARIPSALRTIGAAGFGVVNRTALSGTHSTISAGIARSMGHGLAVDRMHKLQGFLDAEPGLDAIRPFRTFWQPGEITRLFGQPYADPRVKTVDWPGQPLEQIAALDFQEYLPDDVLTKTDRATMAVGLEGREPLLDHRIVEMAFRLPLEMRYGPLGNKHVLRSILYRHVPRPLVDRPKQGFAVPIADWTDRLISSGAVAEAAAIAQQRLGLDRQAVRGALKAFTGSSQGKNRLWLLYVLGRWVERWT